VPLPPLADGKFLCQRVGGARRLFDEPGAAGGGGGEVRGKGGVGEYKGVRGIDSIYLVYYGLRHG
jgi:hypothetical protein